MAFGPTSLKDVMIVCGPATMALAAKTFQTATNYKGELSAAAYAEANTAGLMTNKRMPAVLNRERYSASDPYIAKAVR